jgi:hypothetical protein
LFTIHDDDHDFIAIAVTVSASSPESARACAGQAIRNASTY